MCFLLKASLLTFVIGRPCVTSRRYALLSHNVKSTNAFQQPFWNTPAVGWGYVRAALELLWGFVSGGSCHTLKPRCRNLVFHNMAVLMIRTNRLPVRCNEDKWRQLHPFKVYSEALVLKAQQGEGIFPHTGNAQVMRFTLSWEMTSNSVCVEMRARETLPFRMLS